MGALTTSASRGFEIGDSFLILSLLTDRGDFAPIYGLLLLLRLLLLSFKFPPPYGRELELLPEYFAAEPSGYLLSRLSRSFLVP